MDTNIHHRIKERKKLVSIVFEETGERFEIEKKSCNLYDRGFEDAKKDKRKFGEREHRHDKYCKTITCTLRYRADLGIFIFRSV